MTALDEGLWRIESRNFARAGHEHDADDRDHVVSFEKETEFTGLTVSELKTIVRRRMRGAQTP